MTLRTQKLKEILFTEPEISIERAYLVTESYKETEGEPLIIRRAKALKRIFEEMPIHIREGELIVGSHTSKERGVPLFPDFAYEWIKNELDGFEERRYRTRVTQEDKQKLKEILKYWEKYWEGKAPESFDGYGHVTIDYSVILNKGLAGIIKEASDYLAKLNMTSPTEVEKSNFYRAIMTACSALITFAKRYAELARKLAEEEKDQGRKAELEKIAEICNWVPANPSRNFHEALQSIWFTHLAIQTESNGHAIGLGRFDQYMYPFYKKDLEECRVRKDEAQELLECFFIKLSEIGKLRPKEVIFSYAGSLMFQNMTIGGQTIDGEDSANELSFLILEAMASIQVPQPTISLRYHDKLSEKFLLRALEVVRTGIGMPTFFNDKRIIPILTDRGISLKEARDYALMGCVTEEIPGKTGEIGCGKSINIKSYGYINLPKCVELAMNNGLDLRTGKRLGPPTGDPAKFGSFDDLMRVYETQVNHLLGGKVNWRTDLIRPPPSIILSAIIKNCMEKGISLLDCGAPYNFRQVMGVGIANVADSLAAVKKFVYEEKRIRMEELVDALKGNFKGKEELRQLLLNKAPKFGNDDDYVDQIARRCAINFLKEVNKYDINRENWVVANFQTIANHIKLGKEVGATPDGRKAGEPLADGGVSPVYGRDINGPTAVFKSVAKLDHPLLWATLLNMKFSPTTLNDEQRLKKMASLLKTYFDLGGHHVQFNVISAETLRDAQRHPEKYRSLVVRVAGFSAFFVELEKEVQDEIIARTEHTL